MLLPQTLEEAINIAQRLMDQIIKHDSMQEAQEINDQKRKLEDKGNIINNNNNYQNNYNNNNRNNDYHQQQNRRQETFRTYAATNGYTGNCPLCKRCTLHHIGPYTVMCHTCNRDIMQIGAQKQTTRPQESIPRGKLAFVHFRISTLETTLEDIQIHQNFLQSKNLNHQATILVIEVVDGVVACRGCFGQKGGDVAQFGAKEGKIFVVAAE
ncbi:hypothetical protein Tco_0897347 [Tanacetum coccineum]